MRIGIKSLLAAAAMSVMAVPAIAQDAEPISYEDLLDRISRLEQEVANQDVPPAPAEDGYADGHGYACDCDYCCDDGGLFMTYENVIVTPYFSTNTAFITELRTVADVDEVTIQRQFNWDLEYSPRFELGYLNCDGMGWRARYWHFEHSTGFSRDFDLAANEEAVAEVFDEPGINVRSMDGDRTEYVHALNLRVLDIEGVKRYKSCRTVITGSVGLRYARMDQQYTARELDPATGQLQGSFLNSRHNFEGIGPTIALEGLRRFECSNWGVFINARGSILYGESDINALDGDVNQGVVEPLSDVFIDRNEQDLIPVGELQVGVDYRRQTSGCHELFARVALEGQYWINGGSANQQVSESSNLRPTETDLGFLGLSIATGLDW